jgi:hypothetical protein
MHADGDPGTGAGGDPHACGKLILDLDAFAWRALAEEAVQMGVPIEELASYALLYYLADRDSGRIVRRFTVHSGPTRSARTAAATSSNRSACPDRVIACGRASTVRRIFCDRKL